MIYYIDLYDIYNDFLDLNYNTCINDIIMYIYINLIVALPYKYEITSYGGIQKL